MAPGYIIALTMTIRENDAGGLFSFYPEPFPAVDNLFKIQYDV